MKTYFRVGDQTFGSREEATQQMAKWKTNMPAFSVREVQNTEVIRKTAKGNIITEKVQGSLEQVPRIISTRQLDTTYIVVVVEKQPSWEWNHPTHFLTAADAEQERAKRQSKAEKLAALTDADIKEVHVPTLADILERDADKIEGLQAEVVRTEKNWEQFKKQAAASTAIEIANLEGQITAVKAEAAKRFGLQQFEERFNAAVQAYNKAIHYDEFENEVSEKLLEEHHSDCWPNSDCRGECSYEPDGDEIMEYLLEHADDFEVEEITNEPAKSDQLTAERAVQ